MKIDIVSLRKLPTFFESNSKILAFWRQYHEYYTSSESLKNDEVKNAYHTSYQSVWQTFDWAKMLIGSSQAKDIVYFGVHRDSRVLAFGIGEIRTIGLGLSAMFFVGGPQFLPNETKAQTLLIQEITKYVQAKSLIFALFETIYPLKNVGLSAFSGQTKYLLESTTRLIDLSQSTDEILADMKQKGRYNIKLAEKGGCMAQHVGSNSENIGIFYNLLQETINRDGFSANSKSYYENLLKSRKHSAEGLYFVYFEKKVIAAAILIISGNTAIYYYGASSSDIQYRKLMAPYLLQWEMIQQSKKSGCVWYDFLGIAPEGELHHHLQGVTDFKSKFGGFIQNWPQKQLFVAHTIKFQLYRAVRSLKFVFSPKNMSFVRK